MTARPRPARRLAGLLAGTLVAGVSGLVVAPAQAVPGPASPLFTHSAYGEALGTLRVDLVDMDGDTVLDAVRADNNTGFRVALGLGDGTFAPEVATAAPGTGWSVAEGDVNSDGLVDVVAGSANGARAYLGTGDGVTFTPGPESGWPAHALALADLDGDGDLDLVSYGILLAGDGSGSFAFAGYLPNSSGPELLPVPVDLNGDGAEDVVVPEPYSNQVEVFLATPADGPFTFTAAPALPTGGRNYAVGTGDADGDGDVDLTYGGAGQVVLATNAGDGTFTTRDLAPQASTEGGGGVFADLDGDGATDLASPNRDTGEVTVLLADGTGGYVLSSQDTRGGGGANALTLGDIDADGRLDLASATYYGQVQVFLNRGAAQAPVVTVQPADQSVDAGQVATFSADGTGNPVPAFQWQVDDGGGWADLPGQVGRSLQVTVQAADDGARYRAVLTSSGGVAVTDPATLTVTSAPVVVQHPADQSVVKGTSVTFTAASDDPAATVRWEVGRAGLFLPVPAATAGQLTVVAALADDQSSYRAVFTNRAGSTPTDPAVLTVHETAPVVTTQPADQTVESSQMATFTADAAGDPAATVQWERSPGDGTFEPVDGETSRTYSTFAAYGDDGSLVRAVFSQGGLSTTSHAATLTVHAIAPVVQAEPEDRVVDGGAAVTFAASAGGDPEPTVRWQVSTDDGARFSDLPGEVGPDYTHDAAPAEHGNLYRAVFTNPAGSATTRSARLAVLTPATQPTGRAPSAPQDVVAVQSAPGEVTVRWTAPADEGSSPVTGYEVGISTGDRADLAAAARSHVFTGLPVGAHTVSVRAVNALGSGVAPADAVTVVVLPVTADPVDTDCPDYATQEDAQAALDSGVDDGLDADGDGVACEQLASRDAGGGVVTSAVPGLLTGSATGRLPMTGAESRAIAEAGVALLGLGVLLVLAGRRRTAGQG